MIQILFLLITISLVWLAALFALRKIFSGRLRHPHRRARDMTPVIDISIRISPKIFFPLLPIGTGIFVLSIVPSLTSAGGGTIDLEQLKSLSIFILSGVVSYLYLIRNTTSVNKEE